MSVLRHSRQNIKLISVFETAYNNRCDGHPIGSDNGPFISQSNKTYQSWPLTIILLIDAEYDTIYTLLKRNVKWNNMRECLRGKTGQEIHGNLSGACPGSAVSLKKVYMWIRRSAEGNGDISNGLRSERSIETIENFEIQKLRTN